MASVDCFLSLLERASEDDSETKTIKRSAAALLVVRALRAILKHGPPG